VKRKERRNTRTTELTSPPGLLQSAFGTKSNIALALVVGEMLAFQPGKLPSTRVRNPKPLQGCAGRFATFYDTPSFAGERHQVRRPQRMADHRAKLSECAQRANRKVQIEPFPAPRWRRRPRIDVDTQVCVCPGELIDAVIRESWCRRRVWQRPAVRPREAELARRGHVHTESLLVHGTMMATTERYKIGQLRAAPSAQCAD
jgi:hypothetical protein